MYIIPIVK